MIGPPAVARRAPQRAARGAWKLPRATRERPATLDLPPVTAKTESRCVKVDGADRCKTAIQTNNVEVDDRGYIYAVDRANTGLHILALTGDARSAARFQP